MLAIDGGHAGPQVASVPHDERLGGGCGGRGRGGAFHVETGP